MIQDGHVLIIIADNLMIDIWAHYVGVAGVMGHNKQEVTDWVPMHSGPTVWLSRRL
jgi:hypothetical protein